MSVSPIVLPNGRRILSHAFLPRGPILPHNDILPDHAILSYTFLPRGPIVPNSFMSCDLVLSDDILVPNAFLPDDAFMSDKLGRLACKLMDVGSARMEIEANDLVAYRVGGFAMKLVPAPPGRKWIDQTTRGFANRCLPMHMANQAGWFVLNDRPLRAIWLGGVASNAVVVEQDGNPPYSAISHFGHGLLTFTMPYLFRTPPGTTALLRGPANSPKDAIAPLEGLVETDWAVATAAMSWRFTRPNTWIEFAQDEPICMVVPQWIGLLEAVHPTVRSIKDEPETLARYEAWKRSRDQFNRDVQNRDPKALKQGWQRHYFQGTAPPANSRPPLAATAHRTRLKLRGFSSPPSEAGPPVARPPKKQA